jgi:hypothetical protein
MVESRDMLVESLSRLSSLQDVSVSSVLSWLAGLKSMSRLLGVRHSIIIIITTKEEEVEQQTQQQHPAVRVHAMKWQGEEKKKGFVDPKLGSFPKTLSTKLLPKY